MSATCVIIDDEPLAIDVIKRYIQIVPALELIGEFTNPVEGFAFIQQRQPDLLILDINMPVLPGLELIKTLSVKPKVIVTTAYRDFAVESFELEVMDYLVKPVAYSRFLKAAMRLLSSKSGSEEVPELVSDSENFAYIKVDRTMVKVNLDEIEYVEGLKNYVRIVAGDKSYVTYCSMSHMEDKLPKKNFFRIHKSFLVNICKVCSYTHEYIEAGKKQLPIGPSYKTQAIERLGRLSI
jgi:DNA-binding LytR/AlgR family response regulator